MNLGVARADLDIKKQYYDERILFAIYDISVLDDIAFRFVAKYSGIAKGLTQ